GTKSTNNEPAVVTQSGVIHKETLRLETDIHVQVRNSDPRYECLRFDACLYRLAASQYPDETAKLSLVFFFCLAFVSVRRADFVAFLQTIGNGKIRPYYHLRAIAQFAQDL